MIHLDLYEPSLVLRQKSDRADLDLVSIFPERCRRLHEAGFRDGEDRRRASGRKKMRHLLSFLRRKSSRGA